MKRALVLAALAMALPASAHAKPVTETAQSGSIVATISYDTKGNIGAAKDIKMTVFDGDAQLVDASIPNNSYYTPIKEKWFGGKSVGVQDFDGDGTPEVMFDFFTGGAHCCTQSYLYDGSTLVKHDWGNVGYTLKDYDGDGVPEFNSEDDAFSDLFTFYAASQRPPQVWQYRDGKFDDAFTHDATVVPVIKKAGTYAMRIYTRFSKKVAKGSDNNSANKDVVQGALGALTADDCLLGDCSQGYTLADAALKNGYVHKNFVTVLHKQLKKRGYDPPQRPSYG